MEMSGIGLAMIGLVLGVWTAGAAWFMIRANGKLRQAEAMQVLARRLSRLIDDAPAIPLLVRTDGRIEAPHRLAGWLGLERVPDFLSELAGTGDGGLSEAQVEQLTALVRRTQRTAAPFRLSVTPPGSRRTLALRGALAEPETSPGGAALIWVFDFTESNDELIHLRQEAERARDDFAALVGLIEAAPMPMWFRGPDLRLRLVNSAYVEAVDAPNAETVVSEQIELVEAHGGRAAAQVAAEAADIGAPIERVVTATMRGQRRTLRVTDLPLMREGIAGYAVDIEEMEEQARQFRAFRKAQRQMLDQLSIGVAQFDSTRLLRFANQPFQRIFGLPPGVVNDRTDFDQVLSLARDRSRTPVVRDFPAWRQELREWFALGQAHEEAWPLPDKTHLRIVAQPMPDGGLVMIAEDRTEQLAVSAMRDTLLRTRAATFDNLFEAIAVFAPDGQLEQWNRSFAGTWGLEQEALDKLKTAEELLQAIAVNLKDKRQASLVGTVVRSATLDRIQRTGRVELKDGRTLEYAGVPLPDGNGLLTVLDVTASRRAEEALRERTRALEEADAMKTRFLANMSYEFRTPLTSITGFAELLLTGAGGRLTKQAREYVEAIAHAVGRLTEQVENVLHLSQSEAGLLPIARERVVLLPFLTEVARARETDIDAAGIKLDLRGSGELAIDGDAQQLRRAMSHLLDNAIKASSQGGRIVISMGQRDGMVRIVLADNGRGMSQGELEQALGGMVPDEQRGHRRQGLGIPLARQLIEAHGGTLEIASRPGAGTTVTVKLPA
ncbi:PAS domain-containing sensor histidine kinase [Erythrobacteraceae bacterium CFH 75059]|uniref:sensor histidine kinase n=1 Tax=Qipengyuania thermophila TaxID=2509361 RepID=UPI001020349F|nr:PAS domain-containing sensor histidine kinase [Qipengyuania thermophila]TCD05521.1 PAS domain-containing sensor histidine kinase [Erythrobacteraceae bacterium CFH 75059]